MQLTRGLFRLWVVAAVIWVISAGTMTWQTWPQAEFVNPYDAPPWVDYSDDAAKAAFFDAQRLAQRRDALLKGAAISITPPVIVLLLGMSMIWVVRGFRPEQG
jgi:hypothetical protein